jgi:hypothetical protein
MHHLGDSTLWLYPGRHIPIRVPECIEDLVVTSGLAVGAGESKLESPGKSMANS